MKDKKYEFVIVGSGAGGATLAKGLAMKGRDVIVVEKGQYEKKIGTFQDYLRIYDVNRSNLDMRNSIEGVMLFRAFMAGGTTVVCCGNAMRCLEDELGSLNIKLEKEFAEAEEEMRIASMPEHLLSEASKKTIWASEALGLIFKPMPKFLDASQCSNCGQCIAGCQKYARWTARDYLDQAGEHGANIVYNTTAQQVILQNGKSKGIIALGPQGQTKIYSDTVILAAGGFATPIILQRSGIKHAGTGLFVDLFINTYGLSNNGLSQINEPPMALFNDDFHKDEGFILSPFVNPWKIGRFAELGTKGLSLPSNRLLGMMTKIADESSGRVFEDGKVSKAVTIKDREMLRKGSSIAKEILVKMGASENSILVSKPQGAHPGGTAAIGIIVDNQLQSKEIDNLFVCDASVLPIAPGLPPILTIVALAKRLSKTLGGR